MRGLRQPAIPLLFMPHPPRLSLIGELAGSAETFDEAASDLVRAWADACRRHVGKIAEAVQTKAAAILSEVRRKPRAVHDAEGQLTPVICDETEEMLLRATGSKEPLASLVKELIPFLWKSPEWESVRVAVVDRLMPAEPDELDGAQDRTSAAASAVPGSPR